MIRMIAVTLALVSAPAFAQDQGASLQATSVAWNAPPDAQDLRPSAVPTTSSPETQRAVEQRLHDVLTPEMTGNFGLFVYVSKAEMGPWAQRMYVFQKAGDDLLLLYDWPVSTGRETVEAAATGVELPTTTPAGYYELDPARFFERYRSIQWDEPMPYAMFFRWKDHGVQTGLAIHGTSETEVNRLGMRASAGCVRLAPKNARTLFTLIRDNFKGQMPKFGYDKYTNSIMNNGLMVHDENGGVEQIPGYSVLVYIDEYGGQNLEAQAY
jgi:hypothetical protein